MTFHEAQRYLDSFINLELQPLLKKDASSFNLDRMRRLLAFLGDPHKNLKIIHVAGSKGKGSTCVLTAGILSKAGYKTGLYTSPHLSDCRERIRIMDTADPHNKTSDVFPPTPESPAIDGGDEWLSGSEFRPPKERRNHPGKKPRDLSRGVFTDAISENDLCAIIHEAKPRIEAMRLERKWGRLSFFEVYTAMALYYFHKKRADWVVLETGLGGRLDATNAVSSMVCALTPISLEHTAILGDNAAQIAREKAGIIKSPRQKVVIAPQEEEAMDVFRRRCAQYSIRPLWVGEDIRWESAAQTLEYQTIHIHGTREDYPDLKLSLLGKYQALNAAVAVGIVESLQELSCRIPSQAVYDGLKEAFWPGRLEVAGTDPVIVLDGAHNQASAFHLVESLREIFPERDVTLVLGVCQDKDREGICRELNKITQTVVTTMADHPRAYQFSEGDLDIFFPGKSRVFTSRVGQALEYACRSGKETSLVLITGSLFVVSEARRILSACTPFRA